MPSQFGRRLSGVARVTFCLLERLVEIGSHDYVLRSAWRAEDLPAALQGRIGQIYTPRPRVMVADVLRQALTMPAICRAAGADVVWNVDSFGAARGGRARVTTVHDLFYRDIDTLGLRQRLTMALCYAVTLGGSSRVVAISQHTAAALTANFPGSAARLSVIPNAATLDRPAPAIIPPQEIAAPYALIVGNATPNKNFGAAIAALAALPSATPAITLVHVGLDDAGMVEAAMARAAAPPPLIRLSSIDDARLAALYHHAQCLIVPSLSEGFCLPIVEAQTLGCPVITADCSVMPEVAGDGALYFAADVPRQLADHIAALQADPALRQSLVQRGHRNAARFSWAQSARAYDNLFSELMA